MAKIMRVGAYRAPKSHRPVRGARRLAANHQDLHRGQKILQGVQQAHVRLRIVLNSRPGGAQRALRGIKIAASRRAGYPKRHSTDAATPLPDGTDSSPKVLLR